MKSIGAVAVSTTATFLLLGATGAMSFLYNHIPLPVVCGVQFSHGLQFAITAIKYVRYNYDTATLKPSSSPRSGLILALVSLLFIILPTGSGNDKDAEVRDLAGTSTSSKGDCIFWIPQRGTSGGFGFRFGFDLMSTNMFALPFDFQCNHIFLLSGDWIHGGQELELMLVRKVSSSLKYWMRLAQAQLTL